MLSATWTQLIPFPHEPGNYALLMEGVLTAFVRGPNDNVFRLVLRKANCAASGNFSLRLFAKNRNARWGEHDARCAFTFGGSSGYVLIFDGLLVTLYREDNFGQSLFAPVRAGRMSVRLGISTRLPSNLSQNLGNEHKNNRHDDSEENRKEPRQDDGEMMHPHERTAAGAQEQKRQYGRLLVQRIIEGRAHQFMDRGIFVLEDVREGRSRNVFGIVTEMRMQKRHRRPILVIARKR